MCFLDCYLNPLYIHNIYTSSMDSILCFLEFYLEFYLQPQTYVFFLKVNDTGNKTTRKGDWIKGKNRTLNGIIDNQSKWASDTDSRKEDLKYYFNCKFEPICSQEGTKDVIHLCPPPYLHVVVLGPFNHIWNELKKLVSLTEFEKKHHMKPDGKGGDYSGPTIKKVIHSEIKLLELQLHVGENLKPFIDLLRSLAEAHRL